MTLSPVPTRPPIRCSNGIVATGHQLASQAALRVLKRGGNAIDAAVTAAATLAVVQPDASSLAADMFMLCYSARDRRAYSLSSSGRSPMAMTLEALEDRSRAGDGQTDGAASTAGGLEVLKGPLAATVPGAVRGWSDALERFGTIGLAEALAPAIDYAATGFPVSPRLARLLRRQLDLLRRFPATAAAYLRDGEPPEPGDRLRLPDLAASLRLVAHAGPGAIHGGEVGRRIADAQATDGGLLTEADIAGHASIVQDPIAVSYGGYTVAGQPPVSMSAVLLEELKIVEGFDLTGLPLESAERIHLLVEAKKQAFADMDDYLCDPAVAPIPYSSFLDEGHAAERRRRIDRGHAQVGAGAQTADGDHTTYLAVGDRDGNLVSMIQSLFHQFGSGWVAPDTGILLNDRMNGFSRDPAHVNAVAGGKLTAHTLNAPMLLDGNGPVMAFGTPGGHGQVQSNLQMLTALLDFDLDLQAMVEAPRWRSDSGRELAIETRFPPATLHELERLGHELTLKGDWSSAMGDAQAVRINRATGSFDGGSDRRREGTVLGW